MNATKHSNQMETRDGSNKDYLKLLRFCGEELYPVNSATWHIYKDEEEGMNELWLEIKTDAGVVLSEDTKELKAKPHWELTYACKNIDRKDLTVGFRAEIKSGYDDEIDDYVTNFYYCEHEPSDNNVIEVLAVDEDRLLVRVSGEVTDVNYYDGSKPRNKIGVETWFEYK